MSIAAGDPDATYSLAYDALTAFGVATTSQIDSSKPVTIYSSALHMHLHGTHATLNVQRSEGTNECLLSIPKWNFHWQGSYAFAKPKTLSPGDKLNIECH